MSEKEMAYKVIDTLSDEQVREFLLRFADENTIARIETEEMAADPDSKRYKSVDELFMELDS